MCILIPRRKFWSVLISKDFGGFRSLVSLSPGPAGQNPCEITDAQTKLFRFQTNLTCFQPPFERWIAASNCSNNCWEFQSVSLVGNSRQTRAPNLSINLRKAKINEAKLQSKRSKAKLQLVRKETLHEQWWINIVHDSVSAYPKQVNWWRHMPPQYFQAIGFPEVMLKEEATREWETSRRQMGNKQGIRWPQTSTTRDKQETSGRHAAKRAA